MPLLRLLVPILVGAAGQYVPDSTEVLTNSTLRGGGMLRYWETDLPVPAGERAVSATLVDEQLYVLTDNGSVVSIHAPTGLAVWARNLNQGRYRILPPTHLWTPDGPGPVVFVSARNVYVLDRRTGKPLAKFALPFAYGSPAVGDDEMLYLGSADGHMHAVRWDTARNGGPPIRTWKVRTPGPIRSRPAFDGQALYFASGGGQVHACVAFDKTLLWTALTEGGVQANIILHESGVYAASTGRLLYRIDPTTGRIVWQRRLPTPLEANPIIAGRTLYQDCGDAGLYAIDIDSGQVLWNRPDVAAFVSRRADEAVVISADAEHMLVLDNDTGHDLRSMPIYDVAVAVPNPADDAIYLVSRNNRVLCLRPANVPYLTMETIAEARARLMSHAEDAALAAPLDRRRDSEPSSNDVLRSTRSITPMAGQ